MYRTFKNEFKCESYVLMNVPKYERSLYSQFRFGILPLRVETGRYVGEPVDQRLCRFCNRNEVETHLIFHCDLYHDIRSSMLGGVLHNDSMLNLTNTEKLSVLLTSQTRMSIKYITKAYFHRRSVLYSLP